MRVCVASKYHHTLLPTIAAFSIVRPPSDGLEARHAGKCFCGIFRRWGAGIFSVLYRTGEVTYFYRHIAFFHGILYVCQYKTQFARCNMLMPCVMPNKYMNMPVSNVQGIFEGHEFCVSSCLCATFRQAPRRLFVHENNVFGNNKMYLLTIRSRPPSTFQSEATHTEHTRMR